MTQPNECSECSCDFSRLPGHWGGGLYHYFSETEETFVKREMDRYYKERVGQRIVDTDDAREELQTRERSKHYVGLPVAYEMCPRAKDRIERQIAEQPSQPRKEDKSWNR